MDYPTNMPRDHPIISKGLYAIVPQVDGTADVYLTPRADMRTADGRYAVYVVRGVVLFPGIEEDIRARYDSWCESADLRIII